MGHRFDEDFLAPQREQFSFPANQFPTHLLFYLRKNQFLDLPIMEGRPRYFECLESCIGPRMFRISSLSSWEVFELKKIEDLSVLIFCLEADS